MIIVGLAGGSGSGKTTLVNSLLDSYPRGTIIHCPMDAYYHDHSYLSDEEKLNYNFDHPNAMDFRLLIQHLKHLKLKLSIDRPVYSFLTCSRLKRTIKIKPTKILILEGLFMLVNEELRKELTIKMFLETSIENRLKRIVKRDIKERGRRKELIEKRFIDVVQPMHEQFVEPSQIFADIVINGNSMNFFHGIKQINKAIDSYLQTNQ